MTNPDVSGMLRFLTDELQAAEDAGDRGFSVSSHSSITMFTKSSSVDYGPCFDWLGRFKSAP